MAEPTPPAGSRVPLEPVVCRLMAEDPGRGDTDRAVWALLAVAGELAEIRRELKRRR